MRPNQVALWNTIIAASLVLALLVLVDFPLAQAVVWATIVGVLAWLASDTPRPANRL